MSAKLTKDHVKKLAMLSRLQLSDDEVAKYQEELSAILEYVEQLNSVAVDGLQPAYQVSGLSNVMRKDEIRHYQAKAEDMISAAPSTENGYLKVGRMI